MQEIASAKPQKIANAKAHKTARFKTQNIPTNCMQKKRIQRGEIPQKKIQVQKQS